MGKAAVEVAKAIHYTNAGTVEFLLDSSGRFYFSEMNTRLQVEHRVTELVVGVDLVELQVRIARGEKLPFTQADLRQTGHAVQCRLYAEDPANGFLPSVGKIHDWQVPDLGRLVVDSGLEAGGEVSVHYDPLVAKLVTWGETREEATAAMVRALEQLVVQGPTTNRGFLIGLLRHPDYLAGRIHTGFIDEKMVHALVEPKDEARDVLAQVAATLAGHEARRAADPHLPGIPSGWRNNRAMDQFAEYEGLGRVEYRALGAGRFLVRAGGQEGVWRVVSWDAPVLTVEDPQGLRTRARVVEAAGKLWVHTARGPAVLVETPRFPPPVDEAVKGGFMAPMPGKVVKVQVKDGEAVKRGQVLLVLEAMKMEQATTAPEDGVVQQVLVREGDQVTAGQILVVMKD
jgi:3-methylcrotonyl-CoA carboxylase alpha subunit